MPIRPFIKKPRAFISPLLSKQSIDKESFERFRLAISTYIDNLKAEYATSQSEPNIVTNALKPFFEALGYKSSAYSQTGLSGADLILKNSDEKPGVIIEAKKEGSREFITKDSLNKRALHEAVLYFMRERDVGNLALYHIIITDFYQFYLFDAKDFDRLFWQNKQIKKLYTNYKDPSVLGDGTSFFYEGLQRELERTKADLINDLEIECAYFNLKEYESLDEKKSIALYKLLSSDTLLKEFNPNDANSLNRDFYSELLHILGLEEVKESGKKRIKRSKTQEGGSLYENILDKLITYGKLDPKADEELKLDSVLSLLVIWLNRILFLKLVESQVIIWSDGESKKFLNSKKIAGYDELENLFFKVLAKKPSERDEPLKSKFADVPYLNSSLFSISKEEQELLYISNLDPNKELSYYPKTILKDVDGKKRKGKTNPLFYLFEFLDAYDFSSEGSEELQSESKSLINAAVLGLIFEKLNGYKDGSFYTPSFITMYMAKQSVEKALIEKFNTKKGWSATTITDIYNSIVDKKEANEIINSLLVCDPAVGSGHFLVSTLNHLIYIKHKLGILLDSEGKRIRDYDVEIVNDELIIKDEDGELFEYRRTSKEKTRIQKTLFEEKKSLIENSLFGVDINPNSVNICRLRLWIELLKNSYYHEDGNLETLPNIDINIKCGNSLISRYSLTDDIKTKNIKATIDEYKERITDYKENIGDKIAIQGAIDRLKEQFKLTLKAGYKHRQTLKEKLKLYVYEFGFEGLSKNLTLEAVEFGYLPQSKLIDDDSEQKRKLKCTLSKEIKTLEDKISEFESGEVYDSAFEWRFEFPEVLDENGEFIGFDIVIGNPPYISLSKIKSVDYGTFGYEAYDKTGDILSLFVEKGMTLLKEGANLSFILSNSWLKTRYGERLKRVFEINTLDVKTINFEDSQIFGEATVESCILSLTKASEYSSKTITIKEFNPKNATPMLLEKAITSSSIDGNADQVLMQKIESKGKKLKEWDVSIFRGITTGYNKAFIIDTETKEQLVAKDPKSSEILKPLIRGRDIQKYTINWADMWLINTHNNPPIDIESYPVLKEHLHTHYDKLEKRQDKGKTPYNLRNCAYLSDFERPKIIWGEISDKPKFAYDENRCFLNNTSFMIVGDDLKYILSFLNSKLSKWYFEKISTTTGMGTTRWLIYKIELLPVIDAEDKEPFIDLVDKILEAKKQNPQADTKELEKQIDEMVYELYGLSREEIKIIKEEG